MYDQPHFIHDSRRFFAMAPPLLSVFHHVLPCILCSLAAFGVALAKRPICDRYSQLNTFKCPIFRTLFVPKLYDKQRNPG